MAMRPDGSRDPHPARRARRAVATASGVAFAGLAGGMAINAATSSAETTPATTSTTVETPTAVDTPTTPESTWSAFPVPTTVPRQVTRVPHTQSHGS
jgi:hypothetical protein